MLSQAELGFLLRSIQLSRQGMAQGSGGPFGSVIVLNNQIIAEGQNQVTSTNDPTAHAEVVAIRNACKALNSFQLTDCDLYASCEPCPMCLGAIYWARPKRVIYANTKADAAAIEFDDAFIYNEIAAGMDDRRIPFIHHPLKEAQDIFKEWKLLEKKLRY